MGNLYVVSYTMGMCSACSLILTFANVQLKSRIEANANFDRIRAVVECLGLAAPVARRDDVISEYQKNVAVKKQGEMDVYEARKEGKTAGYAFDLAGRGSYGGPIKGILAVTPDRQRVMAFKIYEQSETPGLGARITSKEWLGQFANKPLMTRGQPGFVVSATAKGDNIIQGITGASLTTFSIVKVINMTIARFLSGGLALEELALGLGVDQISKSTPGYPKTSVKPQNLREEIQRGPFMVTPGCTNNLALGKPVTSGAPEGPVIGELSQVTDGIKKSGEFDYVELGPGLQWAQVDLGSIRTIHAIAFWHFYINPIIYRDVIVQIADDAEFKQNVRTLFNNDDNNSAGLGAGTNTTYIARWWGELVDTRGDDRKGIQGRTVRIYSAGGTAEEPTRFVEVAVYGK